MTQPLSLNILCLALTVLGLAFAFVNAFRDSSTLMAGVVSSRALTPQAAFPLCAAAEFLGAAGLGTAIVATIRTGVPAQVVDFGPRLLIPTGMALVAATVWSLLGLWRGWPLSSSQAALAAMAGAYVAAEGIGQLRNPVMMKVFLVLVASPFAAFLFATASTSLLRRGGEWLTPRARPLVERLMVGLSLLVSLAHGSSNGQLMAGLLMVVFGASAVTARLSDPADVRLLVAAAMGLGVFAGGRLFVRSLAMKYFRLNAPQGLGAELGAAGTLMGCAAVGFPASAAQVITGSIVGAAAAQSARGVRWTAVQEMVLAWVLTIPGAGLLAFLLTHAAKGVAHGLF